MKSLIIFLSIISLLFCVECGFLKEIVGSVTNEVHKISDGDYTLNSVANKIINETKDLFNDLGEILHIKKPKTLDTKNDDIREEYNLKEVISSIKKVENVVKEIDTNLLLKKPQMDMGINGMM